MDAAGNTGSTSPNAAPLPGDIVVGIDESPSGSAALRWAVRQARATGARIRAVHASGTHSTPPVWSPAMPAEAYLVVSDPQVILDGVRRLFASTEPDPSWSLEIVEGAPGPVLVRAAAQAELLVVGTQEHTGLGRLLVGSVSHYCLSHAPCAVVAVPQTPRHAASSSALSSTSA